MEYTFTVFTSTYNRAHTLHRVYESLQTQTFRDFEWLIVDDGSTDETEDLVRRWQRDARFPIRYMWQEHAGSGAATNRGVSEAQGRFFLNLDSDDACVPAALERLKAHWSAIPDAIQDAFIGVTGLVQDPSGAVIGDTFPHHPTDSDALEIRVKYKIAGDKWGFQRTDVLKQFPFPQIEGEKRVPDSIVWNRIALEYKTRFVNDALRIYYPSPNSRGALRNKVRNAKGAQLYYKEFVNLPYPIPRDILLRNYANYVRYSQHIGIPLAVQRKEAYAVVLWCVALPLGTLLYLQDRLAMSRWSNQEGKRT